MSVRTVDAEASPAGSDVHGMTDLEDALWGPEGPSVRAGVLHRLAELAARVQSAGDAGLPPKDYARATAIGIALATARDFMILRV